MYFGRCESGELPASGPDENARYLGVSFNQSDWAV